MDGSTNVPPKQPSAVMGLDEGILHCNVELKPKEHGLGTSSVKPFHGKAYY